MTGRIDLKKNMVNILIMMKSKRTWRGFHPVANLFSRVFTGEYLWPIHNNIERLPGFDLDTKSLPGPICRLARGNPHCPVALDLFGQSIIS
jgi:hypothetical protein